MRILAMLAGLLLAGLYLDPWAMGILLASIGAGTLAIVASAWWAWRLWAR